MITPVAEAVADLERDRDRGESEQRRRERQCQVRRGENQDRRHRHDAAAESVHQMTGRVGAQHVQRGADPEDQAGGRRGQAEMVGPQRQQRVPGRPGDAEQQRPQAESGEQAPMGTEHPAQRVRRRHGPRALGVVQPGHQHTGDDDGDELHDEPTAHAHGPDGGGADQRPDEEPESHRAAEQRHRARPPRERHRQRQVVLPRQAPHGVRQPDREDAPAQPPHGRREDADQNADRSHRARQHDRAPLTEAGQHLPGLQVAEHLPEPEQRDRQPGHRDPGVEVECGERHHGCRGPHADAVRGGGEVDG